MVEVTRSPHKTARTRKEDRGHLAAKREPRRRPARARSEVGSKQEELDAHGLLGVCSAISSWLVGETAARVSA